MSLFPFLAVLICTMGALVLILFAVMRQARLQAQRETRAKAVQQQADWVQQREDARWRTEQLQQSRTKTEADLSELRLQLGHLEDHARRLRQRITELQPQVEKKDATEDGRRQAAAADRAELEAVQAQLAEAQRRVAAARRAVQQRPHSYAVVPYEGPNQTRRRPIYIECRAQTVVLQPEGVALTEADFDGPLGPGNPLAAALRAVREDWVSRGGFDPQRDGEPYPLLLVRPSGIGAYYAARAGLQSWQSQFGYELIGEDWQVEFPAPDARLAEVLIAAVASARREQQVLIAAAPLAYAAARGQGVYRAAPGGGLMREGARFDDDDAPDLRGRPSLARRASVPAASGQVGPGGTGGGAAPGPAGGGAAPGSAGGGAMPGTVGGGAAAPGMAVATPAVGPVGSGSSAGPAGSGGPSGPWQPSAVNPAYAGSPTAGPAASSSGSGEGYPMRPAAAGDGQAHKDSASPEGYVPGRPQEILPQPSSEEAQAGRPLRPGEWHPSEPVPKHRDEPDDKHGKDPKKKEREKEAARLDKHGRDWALRDANPAAIAITRPIRVECHADRLLIAPQPGVPPAEPLMLGERMGPALDRFIAAVWDHMDAWGIAGRNMYWRPVLKVRVAPGAEPRFAELQAALQGSGLVVQREP